MRRYVIPAILAWAAMAALQANSLDAMSVVYSSSGHIHSSKCPAKDGWSHLVPDPVANAKDFFLLTGVSQAAKDELASGDTSFAGWTFDYSKFNSTGGTLYIDVYNSVFRSVHSSGADFRAHYVAGSMSEWNLQWIQYVKPEKPFDPDQQYNINTGLPVPGGNGPIPPANGGFIDPYPNDGTDGGPFYWNSDEIITKLTTNTDGFRVLQFSDYPRVFHPPASSAGMTFELYLVNLPISTEKKVEFVGGIQWGFHGECSGVVVPLPTALWTAMSVLPALVLMKIRRRNAGS